MISCVDSVNKIVPVNEIQKEGRDESDPTVHKELLLENGDFFLLEDGKYFLVE